MTDTPPVIIFSYNRKEALERAVESLSECPESRDTDLFIFVDGPRSEKDADAVNKVRSYANTVSSGKSFRKVTVTISDTNKGLARSIIEGVGMVVNSYGRVIVVEDDLVVLPNFLRFMGEGLARYKSDRKVFSVCGYTNKVKVPRGYDADSYFCTRSSSWGWATWADRWNSIDWTFGRWEEWKREKNGFNAWGGSDCFSMLNACREGKNSSWAIRFCFAQYLQKGVSLFPVKSLVSNRGFDGSGTNCGKWSRFRHEMEDPRKTTFKWPQNIDINRTIYRSAMSYHTIAIRAWSKIMYMLHK